MELLDVIMIDDLVDEQKVIAELIGLDNYKLLVKTFGGGNIYIHKADTLTKDALRQAIINEFNGSNYQALALKYNMSERTIRRITDGSGKENNYCQKAQIKFF